MDEVSLRIDDKEVVAKKGITILEAALENGIYIPHLCYHPDLKPFGGCRLCIVEIGNAQLVISCRTPVKEGISVRTRSPETDKVRRAIVELLFADHHTDCRGCAKGRECELLKVGSYIGLDRKGRLPRLRWAKDILPADTSNPFFDLDSNRCVLCGICIRTCEEIQGASAINFANRGYATKIAPFANKPMVESACESCGECVTRCPVGALMPKSVQRPLREVNTVCPYCGVGCNIYLGVRDNTIVNVRGDVDSPVNKGKLCVKGRFGWSFIHSRERLSSPLTKQNGEFVEASWDEALSLIVDKLMNQKGDQFALLASAKCTNEENYVVQKFARAVMGTNNIDNTTRLCHTPTIVGLHETIGMGAMASSISELENASCIMVIGTNITQAHPVIGLEIRRAARNATKLIVINPREIDLCRFADIWLRPYPGTDVALLMGMSQVIIEEGLLDTKFIEEYGENFEEFENSLDDFSLGRVERITGISREMIAKVAKLYATSKPATILYSSGMTQHSHGTDNVFALANLVLLTGNIGKSSSGLYPLWGQNNAQGACDMGCLPDFYPGYQGVTGEEVRKKFEAAWGVSLRLKSGMGFTEIWQAVLDAKVKVLYIIGCDPALSVAGSQKVREALEKAEFVIAQDIFLSETARFADVVLPAASFAEKEGTFTNTERRVQRVRPAVNLIGDSRPDWQIICELAQRLGSGGFDFSCPEEILSEIASVTPTYSDISYDRLEKGSLQRPYLATEGSGTIPNVARFQTPQGKGKFTPLEYRPPAELSDVEYPLILTTERSLYNQGILTRKVEGLSFLKSKEFVEINPKDAADFGVSDGQIIRVISRRGEIKAEAKITDASPAGTVSMGFHFTECPTNRLTNPALDKAAKIPETKVCAVKIVPER